MTKPRILYRIPFNLHHNVGKLIYKNIVNMHILLTFHSMTLCTINAGGLYLAPSLKILFEDDVFQ
jgi:hypothetical protein